MSRLTEALGRAESRWIAFWFPKIPPFIYALLRVTLGTLGFVDLLAMSDVDTFWLGSGLAGTEASLRLRPLVDAYPRVEETAAYVLLWGGLTGFACFAVGLWTRAAVILVFFVSLVRMFWTPLPLSGAHNLLHCLLFCMIWAESGSVCSVDALLRARRSAVPVSIWPLRLMQFQMCVLYGSSGLWKVIEPTWLRGEALGYILLGNIYPRIPITLPPFLEPAATALTLFVVAFELTFPVLVLHGRTRGAALVTGVLFHLGLAVVMEVGLFSMVVLAGYLAFLNPEMVASRFGRAERPDCRQHADRVTTS